MKIFSIFAVGLRIWCEIIATCNYLLVLNVLVFYTFALQAIRMVYQEFLKMKIQVTHKYPRLHVLRLCPQKLYMEQINAWKRSKQIIFKQYVTKC